VLANARVNSITDAATGWPEVLCQLPMHTAVATLCDRCERASAYLRGKGAAYSDVVQLSGGIERYLQAFPDSGYFSGKNFVFDERVAVAAAAAVPAAAAVVGRCAVCAAHWDSYAPRCRCAHCRVLMLVCSDCLPTVNSSSYAATTSNTASYASSSTDAYESETGYTLSSATGTDATSTGSSGIDAAAPAVVRNSGGLLQLECAECRQRTAVQCTKRATHGFKGGLPLLCRKHFEHSTANSSTSSSSSSAAAESMIDLTVEGCCEGGLKGGHCAKLPRFGMPTSNTAPTSCGPHKREGYVNLMEGLCQYRQ
jgi:Rhodanase C-terminal